MKYYYANAQNEPTGPVELDELQRLATQGVIKDQTPVIPEGGQTWTTYGQVRPRAAGLNIPAIGPGRPSPGAPHPLVGMVLGLVLSILGLLALPWKVLAGAVKELATWGNDRALPSNASDMPVLTFSIIVLRHSTAVVFGLVFSIWALLSLFGAGPLYHSAGFLLVMRPGLSPAMWGRPEAWNATLAFNGFFCGLIIGYFGQLAIASWYELLLATVRVTNDIRRIASK